jgi:transposase-like protein
MRPDVRLHAVVMQTSVHGVSTRKDDDLIATLGISESEVCRIRADRDTEAAAFSIRDLGQRRVDGLLPGRDPPHDQRRRRVRRGRRVVSQAVVVATSALV